MLMLLVGLGLFLPSLVLLHFHMKRAEIIVTKCVERFKPVEQNCCKGSCHLKKQLEQADTDTNESSVPPRIETTALVAVVPVAVVPVVAGAAHLYHPAVIPGLPEGHRSVLEHVPWQG